MFDSLPVIIVTAKSRTAAAEIISEIIDDDATAEAKPEGHESPDRVWRLVNKYYSALVRVRARGDGDGDEPGLGSGPVGAHVLLLARDELHRAAAERRLQRTASLHVRAPLNVLACDAAQVPADLLALCARRRLEPAALRDVTASTGPFPEPRGVPAVRAALHAHAWPGLQRRAVPEHEREREHERELEQQEERFARALRTLGGAATLTAGLEGAERRAAAEQLVAVFAAAIGQPLGNLDLDP